MSDVMDNRTAGETLDSIRKSIEESGPSRDYYPGCGSNSCLVFKPTSQGTNSGCVCSSDYRKASKAIQILWNRFMTATSEIQTLRAKVRDFEKIISDSRFFKCVGRHFREDVEGCTYCLANKGLDMIAESVRATPKEPT